MLIKELANWPGIAGGAWAGGEIPRDGSGVPNGVFPVQDNHATLSCTFEGQELRYHLDVGSAELAEHLARLLSRNLGKTVSELGELRLD